MQGFFGTFPGKGPGLGLLLLRATVRVAAVVQGGVQFAQRGDQTLWTTWALGLLAVMSGALLLIGSLTPVCAILAGLANAGLLMSRLLGLHATSFGCCQVPLVLVIVAVALVFLGPGAFSLDSHLFGRREIKISPSNPRRS
jgi:uncharacterized membrane protein YphA (DoxX/SURF4 family)